MKITCTGLFALLFMAGGAMAQTPAITSSPRYSSMLGTPFEYQITASNDPTSYNVTGLPPGLSINAKTGLISGKTPNAMGTFAVSLGASNSTGTGTATLTLTVLGASVYTGPTKESPYLGTPAAIPGHLRR